MNSTLGLKLAVIIPVKPFREAKSRLQPALSPDERQFLSRMLLFQTMQVARQLGDTVVISRSRVVRDVAKEAGAWSLVETAPTLNAAVQQGLDWAVAYQADAALIIPQDLPLLSIEALRTMVKLAVPDHGSVVIAPCRRNEGTNALLLHPPDLLLPQFGPHSFIIHQDLAIQAGVKPIIYRHPSLALDLDTPQDWRDYTNCIDC